MFERRKNIAVVMSQPESPFQIDLMKGINEEANSLGYNTLLIASLVKSGGSEEFVMGECQIYNLLKSPYIDGVIIVPDLLTKNGASEIVEKILDDFKGPVVYVNSNDKTKAVVGENSDEDFEMMVEHLYSVHYCRNYVCMLGPKEHEHSVSRLKSIRKALQKRKLDIADENIYYGDFWYNEGDNVANAIINKGKLPDAVICISDSMAISLKDAFVKRGVQVPGDVIVVGYDAEGSGASELYSITSVAVNSVALGRDSMCRLASLMDENYKYEQVKRQGKLIISNTCGCRTNIPKKLVADLEIPHCAYDESDSFYSGYNFMNENIVNSLDLRDLLWKINYFRMYLPDIKNLCFCLCKFMTDFKYGIESDTDNRYYSQKMYNCLDNLEKDIVDEERFFPLEQIYPGIIKRKEEKNGFFLFAPLHFNETTFGYVVVENDDPKHIIAPCFSQWIRNCTIAFESLKRQLELKIMYRKFEESTVKDLSTGLYSRNGFNLYSVEMLKKAANQRVWFTFFLGDLNCLKHINDVYGHAEGDKAIEKAAEIFSHDIVGTEIYEQRNFRIGGDEFVKIVIGNITPEEANEFLDRTRAELGKFNDTHVLKYPVFLSMGYYREIPSPLQTIDVILTEADKIMFQDKKRMKAATGFDFERE